MKSKLTVCISILLLFIIPIAGCGPGAPTLPASTALTHTITPTQFPTATLTDTPKPTETLAPTDTPGPQCPLTYPEDSIVLNPKPAAEAGWCEVEYSDFTISYPQEWGIEAQGAWKQLFSWRVKLLSGQAPQIMVLAHVTNQSLEEADKTVMVDREGGQTFLTPVVHPEETGLEKHVQTFGSAEVLVVTTKRDEKTIRRYFWLSPKLMGPTKRMFVYFQIQAPTTDFEGSEYAEFLQTMESAIAKVHLTPTCADGFTRLHAGIYAQVTPGTLPNRVRSGPSKNDEIIAQLYPGTILAVGRGPVCADGLVFWRVYNQNIPGGAGWMAEGDFTEYFLELYIP